MKERNDYFIGLDIGTNSVGFAVTDESYNLLKAKQKNLWGMRLLPEAETAAGRRTYRVTRRRVERRKWRIKLLQELFSEEISKVDPGFFQRMKDSFFHIEDKEEFQRNSLFNDTDFSDKQYFDDYPTVFHLRYQLMNSKDPHDVRLIYLALHHIIKKRGHFLLPGEDLSTGGVFQEMCSDLEVALYDTFEISVSLQGEVIGELQNLLDKKMTKNDKKRDLADLLDFHTPEEKIISSLLAGSKVSLKGLLDLEEDIKLSFSDANCDETLEELGSVYPEATDVFQQLRALYNWGVLNQMLAGADSFSEAKILSYEKHKNDLKLLKEVFKAYEKEGLGSKNLYKEFFKTDGKYYSAYRFGKLSQDDFHKEIKKQIEIIQKAYAKLHIDEVLEDPKIDSILVGIEEANFMPKQIGSENGVIPYQIHKGELQKILENASVYLPFLGEKDESGLSVSEKVIKLLTFRIPYYVGPLNDRYKNKPNGHAWIVRKKYDAITPWNFEEQVDIEKSGEAFIRRMTNKCTYLIGEDVIPKNSLLYSEFMVRNELNNLKIDGDAAEAELKEEIFQELFKVEPKVTKSKLKTFLLGKGRNKDMVLSGFDNNFANSLKPYHQFKKHFDDDFIKKHYDVIEGVILDITLFGEDKKMLKRRIKNSYGDIFSEKEIVQISKYRFDGWGRLSKKLLTEITVKEATTERSLSILSFMRERGLNLMEVLSDKYGYDKAIDAWNKAGMSDSGKALEYSLVDELYISPAVKRSTWQTLKIVDELVRVQKRLPKKIFVEVAREKQESKRTLSRKQQLIDLYKACKTEERHWIEEISGRPEDEYRKNKLYLYYLQMGRCMYTGEPISLDDLYDNNKYDRDHIYPQSKVKDDSLDNLVLVKGSVNREKTNVYPISHEVQKQQRAFWGFLKEKGFISKSKYERLVRTDTLTDDELSAFIARQLVETRQSSKAVIQVLQKLYPKTDIVYVKAPTVSSFRDQFKFRKFREMNDIHHAKDAYLNIVVGNVYDVKFTRSIRNFVKDFRENKQTYSLNRMFDWNVQRGDSIAWSVDGEQKSIATVRKTMARNDVLFTRMPYCRTCGQNGGFFDQTIHPHSNDASLFPVKSGDVRLTPDKYGGFKKPTITHFMLVESKDKKGNLVRSLEGLPLLYKDKISSDRNKVEKFLADTIGLKEPKILLDKVPIDSLLEVDGCKIHLSGKTGNRFVFKHAYQFVLSDSDTQYMKQIYKVLDRAAILKKQKTVDSWIIEALFNDFTYERNIELYDLFTHKLLNTVYSRRFKDFGETLVHGRLLFDQLNREDQVFTLAEIFKFFTCMRTLSDLQLISGSSQSWNLTLSNTISKLKSIYFYHQSVTGLYEQKIDLLSYTPD